jgi:dihydrofolate reductase
VGAIHVHEFMSLDGVIDAPTWTFDYGFPPEMAEAIGAVTERCRGILLGRTTYEMFEPAWSTRTVEDDPGAPFFNDTTKYVVSGTLTTDRGVELRCYMRDPDGHLIEVGQTTRTLGLSARLR